MNSYGNHVFFLIYTTISLSTALLSGSYCVFITSYVTLFLTFYTQLELTVIMAAWIYTYDLSNLSHPQLQYLLVFLPLVCHNFSINILFKKWFPCIMLKESNIQNIPFCPTYKSLAFKILLKPQRTSLVDSMHHEN